MRTMRIDGVPAVLAWLPDGIPLEPQAEAQLLDTARLPFIHHHVAVMPDVHFGIGATIGSVVATRGAIVPAAVGVDIGCGMVAAATDLEASDLPDNLEGVRAEIEQRVPVGNASFQHPHPDAAAVISRMAYTPGGGEITDAGLWFAKKSPEQQLGTLGGGNHFIEICLDEEDRVWIMLHSGSRGLGNRVGRHFMALARRECERWHIQLPNPDLAYLPEGTDGFDAYVAAVGYAQDYARANRDIMLGSVHQALIHALGRPVHLNGEGAINCHHNYVARENHFGANVWVTRKGAVRARVGDMGIIPGSMGAKSFIVRGKGNRDSFNSCSHGAGRAMSRRAARERFTVEDHVTATKGVECRKDSGVLDESPGAYKNIEAVMDAQTDLVQIVHTLKQVVCVKG